MGAVGLIRLRRLRPENSLFCTHVQSNVVTTTPFSPSYSLSNASKKPGSTSSNTQQGQKGDTSECSENKSKSNESCDDGCYNNTNKDKNDATKSVRDHSQDNCGDNDTVSPENPTQLLKNKSIDSNSSERSPAGTKTDAETDTGTGTGITDDNSGADTSSGKNNDNNKSDTSNKKSSKTSPKPYGPEYLAQNLSVLSFPVSHGTVCQSGFARRKSSITGLLSFRAPSQSLLSSLPTFSRQSLAPPSISPVNTLGSSSTHTHTTASNNNNNNNTNNDLKPTHSTYISTAYFIQDTVSKKNLLIWGDVEPDSVSLAPRNIFVWKHAAVLYSQNLLSAIFIECSYSYSQEQLFGHFSSSHLVRELLNFSKLVSPDDDSFNPLKDLTIIIIHVKDDDPIELIPSPYNLNDDDDNTLSKDSCSKNSDNGGKEEEEENHQPRIETPSKVILAEISALAKESGLKCTFKVATPGLCLYV